MVLGLLVIDILLITGAALPYWVSASYSISSATPAALGPITSSVTHLYMNITYSFCGQTAYRPLNSVPPQTHACAELIHFPKTCRTFTFNESQPAAISIQALYTYAIPAITGFQHFPFHSLLHHTHCRHRAKTPRP